MGSLTRLKLVKNVFLLFQGEKIFISKVAQNIHIYAFLTRAVIRKMKDALTVCIADYMMVSKVLHCLWWSGAWWR